MTDNKPKITPPPHLMLRWQGEARDEVRDVANHFDRQSIQMIKAANWGWQQRDASVANELQEARDEELWACLDWVANTCPLGTASNLRDVRRPKPPSLKEKASQIVDCLIEGDCLNDDDAITLRQVVESLPS